MLDLLLKMLYIYLFCILKSIQKYIYNFIKYQYCLFASSIFISKLIIHSLFLQLKKFGSFMFIYCRVAEEVHAIVCMKWIFIESIPALAFLQEKRAFLKRTRWMFLASYSTN